MYDFFYYFNNHLILYVLGISLLILLFVASRINKKDKYILASIVIATILLSICESLEIHYNDGMMSEENFPRYLFSSLSYILRPIIIVLFFHIRFQFKNKKEYLIWLPALFNTIIYTLALFGYKNPSMQFVYWFNQKNLFDRTWLGYTVHVVCGIYIGLLIITSIIETVKNNSRKQVNFIILLTAGMAILAQALSSALNLRTSNTSEAAVLGAALYFMYLSYDKSATEAVTHEREMQAKTTALMLSQIQPHFIYNTLATIQILCEIDPEKAAKTIEDFSKYLRANTDALSKTEAVPVLDEVNHAMAYSKIEMVRFENVKVLFDIKDKDFKLPVLTIEPIVENAIKYGVRGRDEGIVEIKTYKEGSNHLLVIKDNGIGFDINKVYNDNKNHVGLTNVKTRIENMVHGTFEIESIIDTGTTVTITVPEVK